MARDRTSTASVPPADRHAELSGVVTTALSGRELLAHPFYRRWEAGELDRQELAEYAVHYRAFEAALPAVLAAVVDSLEAEGEDAAASWAARNLADEQGHPESHLALFDRFAAALPTTARATRPGPAAEALVETYRQLAEHGPVAALSGLAAYETQAAAIAASKAEGLRRWYGMDRAGTAFWDVHAVMDADHGDWAIQALADIGADPESVAEGAQRAADAWWALLDEREAETAAA